MGVMYGVDPTWAGQTNEGRTHIATKGIVQSGLVLNLDAGVLSSYPGSGTTWTDLSGNGNNGTLQNGVGYNIANGGSLTFDGGIQYISLTANSINTNADLTLNFLLNHQPTIVGYDRVYALLGNNASNDLSVRYFTSGSGTGSITTVQLAKTNSLMGEFSGFTATNNTTYFITITLTKSTNTWSLYVNGSFISSFVNSQTFDTSLPALGKTYAGAVFKGNMYSFFYYNRVLTAAEIQQNYLATKSRYFS
jgi:hypothetical protein